MSLTSYNIYSCAEEYYANAQDEPNYDYDDYDNLNFPTHPTRRIALNCSVPYYVFLYLLSIFFCIFHKHLFWISLFIDFIL